VTLVPAFSLEPTAVVKSEDQLAWIIAEVFAPYKDILAGLNARLDQIEAHRDQLLRQGV
jgi:hypothetical protein